MAGHVARMKEGRSAFNNVQEVSKIIITVLAKYEMRISTTGRAYLIS